MSFIIMQNQLNKYLNDMNFVIAYNYSHHGFEIKYRLACIYVLQFAISLINVRDTLPEGVFVSVCADSDGRETIN